MWATYSLRVRGPWKEAKRLSSQKRGQNKQANKETKNMAHQQECKFSYSTDEDTRNIPHICI
jgi:hypothetical protein